MARPYLTKSYANISLDTSHLEEKGILLIKLEREEAANALYPQMIEDLCFLLSESDRDPKMRAIILTGTGRHFCAGGDIKAMQEKSGMFEGEPFELMERYQFGIQQIPRVIENMQTPLIAAVNGSAIGAGLDISCMCDMRLASDSARFGETFVKIGLVPGDAGTFFLQRVVGYAKAMELTLTGRIIDAKEAEKIGLVHKLVDKTKIVEEAFALAEKIAENAPMATKLAKKALRHGYRQSLTEQLDLMAIYQGVAQNSMDHMEALKAKFDKREPVFKGK